MADLNHKMVFKCHTENVIYQQYAATVQAFSWPETIRLEIMCTNWRFEGIADGNGPVFDHFGRLNDIRGRRLGIVGRIHSSKDQRTQVPAWKKQDFSV
jgi:hypothetical protein